MQERERSRADAGQRRAERGDHHGSRTTRVIVRRVERQPRDPRHRLALAANHSAEQRRLAEPGGCRDEYQPRSRRRRGR